MTDPLHLGLMSGTSMDAVDAILVHLPQGGEPGAGAAVQVRAWGETAMPDELRAELLALCAGRARTAAQIAHLDRRLGALFADAAAALLKASGTEVAEVAAIGCHGQTIWHAPDAGCSWQLGDPNLIAERTGITTVADLRRRDLAAGGQGAPLACGFHQYAFADAQKVRAIINIGGIANLSLLAPGRPTIGFDTGPGNVWMDAWHARHHPGELCDRDGAWAASGTACERLLARALADPYYAAAAPKSTGREHYNAERLAALTDESQAAPQDIQATLLELTARTIADALAALGPQPQQAFICGGGAHNRALMARLAALCPTPVQSTAALGLPPHQVEAAAFAWLARERLAGRPANLPSVTGARAPRTLGAIH